jgi:hypothetical protein
MRQPQCYIEQQTPEGLLAGVTSKKGGVSPKSGYMDCHVWGIYHRWQNEYEVCTIREGRTVRAAVPTIRMYRFDTGTGGG